MITIDDGATVDRCTCGSCQARTAIVRAAQLEVARNYLRSLHVTLWRDWIITNRSGMEHACAFIVDLHATLGAHLEAANTGTIETFEQSLDAATPLVLLSCQRQPRRQPQRSQP